jgi:cysteinyl-tRNA synthetase
MGKINLIVEKINRLSEEIRRDKRKRTDENFKRFLEEIKPEIKKLLGEGFTNREILKIINKLLKDEEVRKQYNFSLKVWKLSELEKYIASIKEEPEEELQKEPKEETNTSEVEKKTKIEEKTTEKDEEKTKEEVEVKQIEETPKRRGRRGRRRTTAKRK